MSAISLFHILKLNSIGLQHTNIKFALNSSLKYRYPFKFSARHIGHRVFSVNNICLCKSSSFKSLPAFLNPTFMHGTSKSLLLSSKKLINNSRGISKSSFSRTFHSENNQNRTKHRSTLYYIIAVGVLSVGLSYAAVPLYRIFCQASGYGGTTQREENSSKIQSMVRLKDREITIRFNADTAASMTWNFRPQQTEIKVTPGETALAFYSARNPTDKPVIGVSTYNVLPFDAGQYFNKIQCFCFEEQMLNPKEEVSMPVFFYIDPEFADDPQMEYVNRITLSYTFFEVKPGMKLPLPGFGR